MARRAHFRVVGRLDAASRDQVGTVTIDTTGVLGGVFSVRPLRRRRAYELPLADVARLVVSMVTRAELIEKRRAKAAARKGR